MSSQRDRSSRLFPELARFSSKKDSQKALSMAMRRQQRKWTFWCSVAAFFAVGGLVLVAALHILGLFIQIPHAAYGGLVGGVLSGVTFGVMQWLWRNPIRRHLRRQLQERGIPICLSCGYDLRGQLTPRCPECGTAFDEALIAQPPSDE